MNFQINLDYSTVQFPYTIYAEMIPKSIAMKFGLNFLLMKEAGKSVEFRKKKVEAWNQDNIKRVGNKQNIKCKNLKKWHKQ